MDDPIGWRVNETKKPQCLLLLEALIWPEIAEIIKKASWHENLKS